MLLFFLLLLNTSVYGGATAPEEFFLFHSDGLSPEAPRFGHAVQFRSVSHGYTPGRTDLISNGAKWMDIEPYCNKVKKRSTKCSSMGRLVLGQSRMSQENLVLHFLDLETCARFRSVFETKCRLPVIPEKR